MHRRGRPAVSAGRRPRFRRDLCHQAAVGDDVAPHSAAGIPEHPALPRAGAARRPGHGTGIPGAPARESRGGTRQPGARPWPNQHADHMGGRLARSSDAGDARPGKEAPMAEKKALVVYAAAYETVEAALAGLDAIEQLHKDELIGQYDAAVIDKENGK